MDQELDSIRGFGRRVGRSHPTIIQAIEEGRIKSVKRDEVVADTALRLMREENFLERPVEERRAIYMALGSTGDDRVLAALEQELLAGGWFSKVFDQHRHDVARCIARLGTPAAREVLERGAHSLKPQLRKACADALSGGPANG